MIPKILHFIFGLDDIYCNKPFTFFHYLNILSAKKCNPGVDINIYYKHYPDNDLFDKLKEFCNLIDINDIQTNIVDIPFYVTEHIGDFLRLQLLYNSGGIYLDVDTVCIRSFDNLLSNDCVMGEEWGDNNYIGLCNAAILSKPGNLFIKKWINSYYTDYKSNWNYNSVIVPDKISKHMSGHITIEPQQSFFKYSWDSHGFENIFTKNSNISDCYSLHLWESKNYNILKKYNNEYIMSHTDTLSNIYKHIL